MLFFNLNTPILDERNILLACMKNCQKSIEIEPDTLEYSDPWLSSIDADIIYLLLVI